MTPEQERDLALHHLTELTMALNTAFISSWQSTHHWQQQLDAATEFLSELNRTGDAA